MFEVRKLQRRERVTRLLALFLALGVLAGCASGGVPGGELLSDWRPPGAQSCSTSEQPVVLPPAAEVVNEEGMASEIREVLPAANGYVLFSIRQDSTGTWERVAPIESDLPAGDQERLTGILRPRLTTATLPGLRLRVGLAEDVSVSVGRQQHCGPAVANRDMYSRELEVLYQRHLIETEVTLRVFVREDGTHGASDLMRGSGNPRLDADILETATRLDFHPALSDRIPVPVWIQMPVTLRGRR